MVRSPRRASPPSACYVGVVGSSAKALHHPCGLILRNDYVRGMGIPYWIVPGLALDRPGGASMLPPELF